MPSSIWTYCYTFTLGEREREAQGGGGGEGGRGRPFTVFLYSGRTGELLAYWEYLRASVTEMALQYRDALARSEEGMDNIIFHH